MAIGTTIKTIRVERRYSQRELAREAGGDYRTIWNIENTDARAYAETVWKIAGALGVTVEEIMERSGEDMALVWTQAHKAERFEKLCALRDSVPLGADGQLVCDAETADAWCIKFYELTRTRANQEATHSPCAGG